MDKEIVEGKLDYDEDGKYAVIENAVKFNLSDLLDTVYAAKNNRINLRITNGNELLFQEDSTLYKNKNKHNFYTYFVTGADLETILFDNVGKEVTVEVAAKSVGAGNYEQFYSKMR